MSRPVPNFVTIAGHRVMFEYREIHRLHSRVHALRGPSRDARSFRRRSYAAAARGSSALPVTNAAPSQSSGAPSPRSGETSSRLQVLTPKTAPRTTAKGLLSWRRDGDSDSSSGSSAASSCVEEETRGASASVASASASSGADTTDIETGPTRSASLTSPASPSGDKDCSRSATSEDASPAPPEQEETSHPVSNEPANVLAPVKAQDLGGLPQAPARDDRPIGSRGHYALPEVDDRASSDPFPERVAPHKGRRPDPPLVHPASGRERRSRSRSCRRRGDGAGRDSGAQASSRDTGREPRSRSRRRQGDEQQRDSSEGSPAREARQRRTGLEVSSSDSDAPPRAKAPRLVACEVLSPPADLASCSDHLPLVTTLKSYPGTRNDNQHWRLDSALLRDEISTESIRERLRASVANAPEVTLDSWDALKAEWRRILQEEGKARKRRTTARLNEILRRIRIIREADTLTTCTRGYLNTLEVESTRLL
nr:uncharacterized protein LOC119183117 [Rhipicephalus microplus]